MRAWSTPRCCSRSGRSGALDDAGRQRFHEEQMLAAEMCLVPRDLIPPTVPALRAWMADVEDRGELLVTDNARKVAELFLDPPARGGMAARAHRGLATRVRELPPLVREMYGFPLGPARQAAVDAAFAATRAVRPFLPAKYRYLAPYDAWRRRQRGRVVPDDDRARAALARHPARESDRPCVRVRRAAARHRRRARRSSWEPIPGSIEAMAAFRARRAARLPDHEHDDASAGGAGRDAARRPGSDVDRELDRHRGDRDGRALAARAPGRAGVRPVRRRRARRP